MAMPFLTGTVQQTAALPFVVTAHGVELLLITSQRRQRWIIPKGWPQKGLSLAETARREAWEEAGLRGLLVEQPLGHYRAAKRLDEGYDVPADVLVFPLLVREQALDWPERAARGRSWYPFAEALGLLSDAPLARLLAKTLQDDGEKLRSMAAKIAEPDLVAGLS